jgi:hypothetical protein
LPFWKAALNCIYLKYEVLIMLSRRRLLVSCGVLGLTYAARPLRAALALPNPEEVAARRRVARVVREYDAQGIHRTATDVDEASAHWLANQLQAAGVEAKLESFPINRVDLDDTFLDIDGRRIGGVPLFDAGLTASEGISGHLGPVGSNAEIGLFEASPQDGTDRPGPLRQALDGSHKAVVIVTRGGRPGLSLINASRFLTPDGVPALQVSSVEADWLRERVAAGASARLVASATRRPADAFNVVGRIPGRDLAAAPLVVMTPRSGWWTCAGERAGGIAAWLEAARAVAAAKPVRDVHFLASSGHELGQIGLDAYLEHRAALVTQAKIWLHFGANIGAGRQIRLQPVDAEAQSQGVAALAEQGLVASQIVPPGTAPGGEAGTIFHRHGRYLSLQGDNPPFHNPADRWPEAVDVNLATRQVLAFATLAAQLAKA